MICVHINVPAGHMFPDFIRISSEWTDDRTINIQYAHCTLQCI